MLQHLRLGLDGKQEVIFPGPDIEHPRIVLCELELPAAKRLVEELGRLPHAALRGHGCPVV